MLWISDKTFEITEEDVKHPLRVPRQLISTMGHILPADIGKRGRVVNPDLWQVENDAQFTLRKELAASRAWWQNELSLNEQRAYAKEVRGILWEYTWNIPEAIREVWIAKGRP